MATPASSEGAEAFGIRAVLLYGGYRKQGALEERLRDSPFAVLLDEGFDVKEVGAVIRDGAVSVAGAREVLLGAPIEWVEAWEEGGR